MLHLWLGFRLGLLLWRAQQRMLLNQTLRSRRPLVLTGLIVGAFVLVFVWLQESLVTLFGLAAAARLHPHIPLAEVLGFVFLAYALLLLFSSLVFSLNAMLINPDLDLLLPAPWPIESVLAGRMLVQVARLLVLSLLLTLPILVLLAAGLSGPGLFLAAVGLLAVYPVLPVVGVSVLVLAVVRFIPAGRGREALAALAILLALGINLVYLLANPAFGTGRPPPLAVTLPDTPLAGAPWLPWGWAGRAAAGALTGDWGALAAWGLLLVAVSALALVASVQVSGRLYLAGWVQISEGRRQRRRRWGAPVRTGFGLPGLTPLVTAVVTKDWRLRRRDLAQLARLAMPVAFFIVLVGFRAPRLLSLMQSLGVGPVAALAGLAPSWLLLFALTTTIGLTAVSLEGKAIWIYVASPNPMRRLLEAKCWETALPTLLAVLAVGGLAEALIRPGWVWALGALGALVCLSAAVAALMVGIGGTWARFDWTDARRMVNPAAAALAVVAQLVVTSMTALLAVAAIALAAAAHLPLAATWLLALAVSSAIALGLALLALAVAAERLSLREVA